MGLLIVMYFPGPLDEDTINSVPECVYVLGLLLQDIWASWLPAWRGSVSHIPCGSELSLWSLHHERVWLHLWEPATRLLRETWFFLLLGWSNIYFKIQCHEQPYSIKTERRNKYVFFFNVYILLTKKTYFMSYKRIMMLF